MPNTPLPLTFPAPEQLLWICPECGPSTNSRIEPSQIFRRSKLGQMGNSEWRKIQCDGCSRKYLLRIDSSGEVSGKSINARGESGPEDSIYSAVDEETGQWRTL